MKDKNHRNPHILVAPLDWGLGHTARCIPLVRELLAAGANVSVAGNEQQGAIFTAEFPGIKVLHLDGYAVRYARSAIGLLPAMIRQLPRISRSIRKEHAWLKKIALSEKIDAVISDNRYGLYHSGIPSIFITHQLLIKTPMGKWANRLLQKQNYRYINKFSACWVPDEEQQHNLAGELSHPSRKPAIPVSYIGLLSRLNKNNVQEIKDHLFISLSGPEPQRSILEEKIVAAIAHYNGSAVIVRGLPVEKKMIPSTNSIRFYNHLESGEFTNELNKAAYVISRTGYSTIMDIASTGKKSILIPTPGQTEQEYLAKHCLQQQIAYCISQKEFNLQAALQAASTFNYRLPVMNNNAFLPAFISSFVQGIKAYDPDLG